MGQGTRIAKLAAACSVVAGLPAAVTPEAAAASGGCANADASAGGAPVQELDAATVCLINEERAQHGLPGVTPSRKLDRAAQSWSRTMVARSQFSHAGFVGRINAVGYDWQEIGENIATGYRTPRQAVIAWMASPEHCRNVLDPSFRNIGTGEDPAPVRGWATGPATWTQDFGLTMSQSAASHNGGPQAHCPYR